MACSIAGHWKTELPIAHVIEDLKTQADLPVEFFGVPDAFNDLLSKEHAYVFIDDKMTRISGRAASSFPIVGALMDERCETEWSPMLCISHFRITSKSATHFCWERKWRSGAISAGCARVSDCGTRMIDIWNLGVQGECQRLKCFYWERVDRFPINRTPSLLRRPENMKMKKSVKKMGLRRVDEMPASTHPVTVRQSSCLSIFAKQMRDLHDMCKTQIA